MTPQEKKWLESAAGDPAKLRKKICQHRILIVVLAVCTVCCSICILFSSVSSGWWALPILLSAQIAGNLFNLREASRLLEAAEAQKQIE